MRYSLINPAWSFLGSIYFGCREPHLPLEFGYSRALLEKQGHDVQLVDGQLEGLSLEETEWRVSGFKPDFIVVTTAPSYLFWRCAPPELRVPAEVVDQLRHLGARIVCVGPHASTTPVATLEKTGADIAIVGECEELLPRLAERGFESPNIVFRSSRPLLPLSPHASDMSALPAVRWGPGLIANHRHHHHRFDISQQLAGAEMETSRGCPYHCTFCAKENFRNTFRRRPLQVIAEELDGLVADGAEYVYFIDEIFLPFRDVLDVIAERRIPFGIQTRIDLWNPEMIERLGQAGCVSLEAGVESITEEGRAELDKKCRLTTEEMSDRLILAKHGIAFVQANLLNSACDDPDEVRQWRDSLRNRGVWANDPVPMFPYPGSPDYTRRWGLPDDHAWERAHDFYLNQFESFSDIQEQHPAPLVQLEVRGGRGNV